ncbi:MAG: PAS domain-containing protein, partial [Syntrophaceae bacterium]|nr:PAS domain-containing protein [Syntrophaceae bacterium]
SWAQQAIKTGEPLTFIDQRNTLWFEHHYYPVKDDRGQVIRLAVFSRDVTEQYQAERILKKAKVELQRQSIKLEESNTALKVLFKNIEEEKNHLADTITTNLRDAVLPYIGMLKKERGSDWQAKCLDALETNLKNILSPFVKEISCQHESLTPSELQVANLIRNGKASKEIADLLNVGVGTVNTHRNNIRKKLGLSHGKINLRHYLRTVTF